MTTPTGEVELLERAIGYAVGNVAAVTPPSLLRPTPCSAWDLRTLLRHVNDSLAALYEGIGLGTIGTARTGDDAIDTATGLVSTFRNRASHLIAACTNPGRPNTVITIADRHISTSVVAITGAVEIAVHGWDIGRACGRPDPIPPKLAHDLLDLVGLVVTDATRGAQFNAPVAPSAAACPGDRLVAYLGRHPTQ